VLRSQPLASFQFSHYSFECGRFCHDAPL
jgi:hypothetical protein